MQVGFIVEGFHDENRIANVFGRRFPTVVTQGTRFTRRTRMDIDKILSEVDELYILTDPDEAGDIIANTIQSEYPQLKRIHVDASKCVYVDRKYRQWTGVEYAQADYLKELLSQYI